MRAVLLVVTNTSMSTTKPDPDPKANGRRLAAFMDRHSISLRAAAAVFGFTHPAIKSWRDGRPPELDETRLAIERWTNGEVPAAGWDSPDERARREAMSQVAPFQPPTPAPEPTAA